MKPGSFSFLFLLLPLLLAGCATSTIEKRKHERYFAYSELPPEERQEIDAGRIKVGMNPDAVYIAWGKPSQILMGESAHGTTTTWLYNSTYLREHHYWSYRSHYYGYGGRIYSSPYLISDYYPHTYVRAEVIFHGNKVKEWRSLPQPGY